jgi:hypothetical protein
MDILYEFLRITKSYNVNTAVLCAMMANCFSTDVTIVGCRLA